MTNFINRTYFLRNFAKPCHLLPIFCVQRAKYGRWYYCLDFFGVLNVIGRGRWLTDWYLRVCFHWYCRRCCRKSMEFERAICGTPLWFYILPFQTPWILGNLAGNMSQWKHTLRAWLHWVSTSNSILTVRSSALMRARETIPYLVTIEFETEV